MAGEISSYGIKLMKGTTASGSTTYAKLVDIKDFPDLGGAPETLDITTLSDAATRSINGIQQLKPFEFTANYTKADYDTLKALENATNKFAIYFGNNGDGSDGKWGWEGQLSVYPLGAKVNAPVEMKITISASTVIAPITA